MHEADLTKSKAAVVEITGSNFKDVIISTICNCTALRIKFLTQEIKKLTKEVNKATYFPVLEFLSLKNNKNKDPITGSKIKDDKIGKFINSKLKMLIMQKNLSIS